MKFKNQARAMKMTRAYANLTQQEMAKYMRCSSAQMVSNIERGLAGIPQKYWRRLESVGGVDFKQAYLRDVEESL